MTLNNVAALLCPFTRYKGDKPYTMSESIFNYLTITNCELRIANCFVMAAAMENHVTSAAPITVIAVAITAAAASNI